VADDRTYGFSKDDAESLIQGISNGESWFPEIKPRGNAGGGVQIIRFEISAVVNCATCQANALVLSRPPGVLRVRDEDDYGELIVYDLCRGWLHRPDIELYDEATGDGARGYAARLVWENQECAIDPYLDAKWEIISLLPFNAGCPAS
jgi:hypothetical protein